MRHELKVKFANYKEIIFKLLISLSLEKSQFEGLEKPLFIYWERKTCFLFKSNEKL
jgi:hypothetical protein